MYLLSKGISISPTWIFNSIKKTVHRLDKLFEFLLIQVDNTLLQRAGLVWQIILTQTLFLGFFGWILQIDLLINTSLSISSAYFNVFETVPGGVDTGAFAIFIMQVLDLLIFPSLKYSLYIVCCWWWACVSLSSFRRYIYKTKSRKINLSIDQLLIQSYCVLMHQWRCNLQTTLLLPDGIVFLTFVLTII